MSKHFSVLLAVAGLWLLWVALPGVAEGKPPRLWELQQAVQDQPGSPKAHYDLGLGYERAGHPKKALRAFQQAIRLKPDYAEAYYELGRIKSELGDYEPAIEAFKQAIKLQPDNDEFRARLPEEYNRQGLALIKQNRLADAVQSFQESIRNNPLDETARNNLGVAYVQQGRLGDAMGAFQELLRINPDNATARYNLGVTYHLRGYETAAYAEVLNLKGLDPAAAGELSHLVFQERIDSKKRRINR